MQLTTHISRAVITKEWSCTSTFLAHLHGLYRDNFVFFYLLYVLLILPFNCLTAVILCDEVTRSFLHYQVLIDNGFTPEWITLQKEISNDMKHLRESLARCRTEFGHLPLNDDDKNRWNEVLTKHKEMAKKLNAKIDKYNLLVPLLEKQKLHILLERESENILKTGATRYDVTNAAVSNQRAADQQSDFLSFLGSFYLW